MNEDHFYPSAHTLETHQAAAVCLRQLSHDALQAHCAASSPHGALCAISDSLQLPGVRSHAWVARSMHAQAFESQSPSNPSLPTTRSISAWPAWLPERRQRADKPLLYLLRSESLKGLHAALAETQSHGIFCNDAEAFTSRWPKGVQPALPLWLSARRDGTPYDPASGAETLAILRQALHALYVEDVPGFIYVSAHAGGNDAHTLQDHDAQDAFKGLYLVAAAKGGQKADVRLLGAGALLSQVRHAAELLHADWGINSEVWSCPSYTRLARDAQLAQHWNMLHPLSGKQASHLDHCLGSNSSPLIAVTGYAQHIAGQIGGFIPARFIALGVDSCPPQTSLDAHWIVINTLQLLVAEQSVSARQAQEAAKKYGLI